MTPQQYRAAIKRLGLNQRQAARFLGVSDRQSRRFVAGDAEIPEGFARLLRHMVKHGFKPEDVK